MKEPRIVTPQEAQAAFDACSVDRAFTGRLLHSVIALTAQRDEALERADEFELGQDVRAATGPNRTRAAVVKALHRRALVLTSVGEHSAADILHEDADAIENGADW